MGSKEGVVRGTQACDGEERILPEITSAFFFVAMVCGLVDIPFVIVGVVLEAVFDWVEVGR